MPFKEAFVAIEDKFTVWAYYSFRAVCPFGLTRRQSTLLSKITEMTLLLLLIQVKIGTT